MYRELGGRTHAYRELAEVAIEEANLAMRAGSGLKRGAYPGKLNQLKPLLLARPREDVAECIETGHYLCDTPDE